MAEELQDSANALADRTLWVALLAAAIVAPLVLPEGKLNVLVLTVLFVYLCVAWNIVGGFAGQFCLGHSLFLAAGAYTSTLLQIHLGISPWFGMLAGGILAAAIGVAIAWLSFRYTLPPLSFALVTLSLSMLGFLAVSSIDFLGASRGLQVPTGGDAWAYQFAGDLPYYYTVLIQAVLAVVLTLWLYHHKIGLYFRALRDNERAALAIGIPVLRYKMLALAISGFLTALAGTFYAQYLMYVEPHTFVGLTIVIEMILFTVVGGTGTRWGPVLGPLLLVPLGEFLRANLGGRIEGLHLLIYGLLLVAVIRFLPGGLSALFARIATRYSSRFKS